jgi:hypothetical protein
MQTSRAVGAVVAAAGLLAVAGRWGRERRFWLPAALIWVGSGALVAFDVLTVVLNRLFLMFGTAVPEAEWAPIDTVLVLKGVIGVLAAVLGVLAVTAAAKNRREAARNPAQRHVSGDRPYPVVGRQPCTVAIPAHVRTQVAGGGHSSSFEGGLGALGSLGRQDECGW